MAEMNRRNALTGAAAACLSVGAFKSIAIASQPREDTAIMEAFGRWAAQMRTLDTMAADADDDAFSDACDVADEIVSEIAGMPAVGMAGFAVKTFLLAHDRYGGSRGNSLRLGPTMQDDDSRGGGLHRSLLDDFRQWMPAV